MSNRNRPNTIDFAAGLKASNKGNISKQLSELKYLLSHNCKQGELELIEDIEEVKSEPVVNEHYEEAIKSIRNTLKKK